MLESIFYSARHSITVITAVRKSNTNSEICKTFGNTHWQWGIVKRKITNVGGTRTLKIVSWKIGRFQFFIFLTEENYGRFKQKRLNFFFFGNTVLTVQENIIISFLEGNGYAQYYYNTSTDCPQLGGGGNVGSAMPQIYTQ